MEEAQKRIEADKIRAEWRTSIFHYKTGEFSVKNAALLAWEGYLNSVECMNIKNTDIIDIPRAQMEKLTSIVFGWIWIEDITDTIQLSSILGNVKSTRLELKNVELSEKDTRALVTAMENYVEIVGLDNVTLNVEDLCQYTGRGWGQAES